MLFTLQWIPNCLVSASNEALSLTAQMSSVTSCEHSVPFLIDMSVMSGSVNIAPMYAAVMSTAKKPTKKKYKPVMLKVRPILGELPDKFRIIRNITRDPLEGMPILDPNLPVFQPCGCYTQEWQEIFDKNNAGFLLPEEHKLLHHFMMLHQDMFTWNDSEQGHFREDFFPLVDIPVVPHTLGTEEHSYPTWII